MRQDEGFLFSRYKSMPSSSFYILLFSYYYKKAFPPESSRNVCFWIPPPFGQSYSEKGKQRHIPCIIAQEFRWIETTQPVNAGTSRFFCLPRQTSLFTHPSLSHPVVDISNYIYFFLLYRFSHVILGYSIYPMYFTRCEGLSSDFKTRFKMYFFRILPPTESNRQEKPASKVWLVTVDLHC